MVFTTYQFVFLFLPLALVVYYLLPGRKIQVPRTLWLVVISYVFYGWERPDFLLLIFGSTCLDYTCGRIVANRDSRFRKAALICSVVGNLALLGYFKYFNLTMDSVNGILAWMGRDAIVYAQVVLPIGISFYTFQTMSYTIDIYRGEAEKGRNFLDVACYVALFPQLIAGPIVRYKDLADQLRERAHGLAKFGHGALIFMCGFSKKILIADSAARISDLVFESTDPGVAAAWMGIMAYAVQIYFDFSGYSDMAIGLGRMIGFEFPINFASPYRSKSITEFWRRWHISLSTWLRDYLYVPLGGNKKGAGRTYLNLAIVMLLGGLWHGAQWTFVVWGAFHGLMLAFERSRGKTAPWGFLPPPVQVILTFLLVCFGWVFFRAETFGSALNQFGGMVGLHGWNNGLENIRALELTSRVLAGTGLVLCWLGVQSDKLTTLRRDWTQLPVALFLCVAFVVAVAHMFYQDYSPFLYFRF